VFRFDFQLFFAGLANPVMLSFDEGMVVDSFSVVIRAEIAFHEFDSTSLRASPPALTDQVQMLLPAPEVPVSLPRSSVRQDLRGDSVYVLP